MLGRLGRRGEHESPLPGATANRRDGRSTDEDARIVEPQPVDRDAGTGIHHERTRPRLRERHGGPVAHDDGGTAEQPRGAEALPFDGDGTGGHPPRDGPVDPRHRPLGSRSGQSVAEGSHVAVEGSATVHLEHGEPTRRDEAAQPGQGRDQGIAPGERR